MKALQAAGPEADFGTHVGVRIVSSGAGCSRCTLALQPWHFNVHQVVHGGAVFTLADRAMGAALYSLLSAGELCATIDIRVSYLKAVTRGPLQCDARVRKRGRRVAFLEAEVLAGDELVATASASFAVFADKVKAPRPAAAAS